MSTNNWAIQLSRSIFESEIWNKPPEWLKVWIYILCRVNFSDTKQFKRWEQFFQYDNIAMWCWVKYKTVVNCVKFLKERIQIEVRKSSRGAIIKVNNYDKYQNLSNYGKTEGTQKEDKGNTEGNTIREEGKKEKKEKKVMKIFWDYVKIDKTKYDLLISDFWELNVKSKIEDINNYCGSSWKKYKDFSAVVRSWLKKDWIKKKVTKTQWEFVM